MKTQESSNGRRVFLGVAYIIDNGIAMTTRDDRKCQMEGSECLRNNNAMIIIKVVIMFAMK